MREELNRMETGDLEVELWILLSVGGGDDKLQRRFWYGQVPEYLFFRAKIWGCILSFGSFMEWQYHLAGQ